MPMINYDISLFIFRRDLRLYDNTALIQAHTLSNKVIPLFICTPAQISDQNKFKSSNAIQFMIESLEDLDKQISKQNSKCKLWVAYGDEIPIINKIYSKIKYQSIFINEDYSPYSIKRDSSIRRFCKEKSIDFSCKTDILLTNTLETKAKNGNYYKIFTQFYNTSIKIPIRKPKSNNATNFYPLPSSFQSWNIHSINKSILSNNFYKTNPNLAISGGRTSALKILSKASKFSSYKKTHDILATPTTHLSPHNKFGTVSIREVYASFKTKAKSIDLCKQLYWRDFYYYASVHFQKDFYSYNHIVKTSKNKTKWENKPAYCIAWQTATTGFPIVDAGMTELNTTGYMHNRARLITSSFLVKDLLVNWKYGEQYFSKKLVDVDRAQNVGNWCWSSSFGLDSSPFLRILNPHTQSSNFDPTCVYIKKWLPQLSKIQPNHLHNWHKYHHLYPNVNYPPPIVNHDERRLLFIKYYNSNFK